MNRTQAQKLWLCCRSNCHLCLKKNAAVDSQTLVVCLCKRWMWRKSPIRCSHSRKLCPLPTKNCRHRAHGRSLPLNLQAAKKVWALCSARKLRLRISVLSGINCNLSFGSLAALNAGMLSDKTFTFLGTQCHSTRGASVNWLTGKMFALTLDSNNKKCCKEAWFNAGLINQV